MLITSSNPALNISRARPSALSAQVPTAAAPEASDSFTLSGINEEKPKSFLSKNLMGIVGGAIGVAGGAALGMSGGVLGAIAGAAAAPVLGVIGAAVGGAAAGKAFIHAFGYRAEKDGTSWYPTNTIGVLIGTIAAAGAGIALGGVGGFVGGAALGLAGGAAGGLAGAAAAGISLGAIGGMFGHAADATFT